MDDKFSFDVLFNFKANGGDQLQRQIDKIKQDISLSVNLDSKSKSQILSQVNNISKACSTAWNSETNKWDFKKLVQGMNSFKVSAEGQMAVLNSLGATGTSAFDNITKSMNRSTADMIKSSKALSKVLDGFAKTALWTVESSIVRGVVSTVNETIDTAKKLDRTLTDIRLVTDFTARDMERITKSANQNAKALNTTTSEYLKAATTFYQQGLSEIDVNKMVEATTVAAQIAGSTAEEMAEYLTATTNAFGRSADQAMQIVDQFSAVAASTATSFEEMSIGMQKVASQASAVGLSIENTEAALATIQSVTRESAESVGTSLKTILGRMTNFKNDAQGVFKDDNGEMFGAPDAERAIQKLGKAAGMTLSMFDKTASGGKQLKDMSTIINDIGEAWQKTDDASVKAGVASALAGSRMQNRFDALFDNFDKYKEILETASSADGFSSSKRDVYAESVDASIERLKQAKQELSQSMVQSGEIKTFYNVLTMIVKSTNVLLSTLKPIPTIISLLVSRTKLWQNLIIRSTNSFNTIRNTIKDTDKAMFNIQKGIKINVDNEPIEKVTNEIERMKQIGQSIGGDLGKGIEAAAEKWRPIIEDQNQYVSTLNRIKEITQEIKKLQQQPDIDEDKINSLQEELQNLVSSSDRIHEFAENAQLSFDNNGLNLSEESIKAVDNEMSQATQTFDEYNRQLNNTNNNFEHSSQKMQNYSNYAMIATTAINALIGALADGSISGKEIGNTIQSVSTTMLMLQVQTIATTIAMKGLNAVMQSSWIGLVITAFITIGTAVARFVSSSNTAKESVSDLTKEYKDSKEKLDDYNKSLEENNKRLKELEEIKTSGNLTFELEKELEQIKEENIELQNQIALEKQLAEEKKNTLKSDIEADRKQKHEDYLGDDKAYSDKAYIDKLKYDASKRVYDDRGVLVKDTAAASKATTEMMSFISERMQALKMFDPEDIQDQTVIQKLKETIGYAFEKLTNMDLDQDGKIKASTIDFITQNLESMYDIDATELQNVIKKKILDAMNDGQDVKTEDAKADIAKEVMEKILPKEVIDFLKENTDFLNMYAKKYVDSINLFTSVNTDKALGISPQLVKNFDAYTKNVKKATDALTSFRESGKIDADTISSLQEVFSGVEGFNDFINSLTSGDYKSAIENYNQLISNYLDGKIALQDYTQEEMNFVASQLESLGVTNAANVLLQNRAVLLRQDYLATMDSGQALEYITDQASGLKDTFNSIEAAQSALAKSYIINSESFKIAFESNNEEVKSLIKLLGLTDEALSLIFDDQYNLKIDYSDLVKMLGVISNFKTSPISLDTDFKSTKEYKDIEKNRAKSISDANKQLKNARETYEKTMRDIDKEQRLADFNYELENTNEELERTSFVLENLKEVLDSTFEEDYSTKVSIVSDELKQASLYNDQLETSISKVLAVQPKYANELKAQASALKDLQDKYYQNKKAIIEYRNELIKIESESITKAFAKSVSDIDKINKTTTKLIESLKSPKTFDRNIFNTVLFGGEKSQVDLQKEENEQLIDLKEDLEEKLRAIENEARKKTKEEEDADRQKRISKAKEALQEAETNHKDTMENIKGHYDDLVTAAKTRFDNIKDNYKLSLDGMEEDTRNFVVNIQSILNGLDFSGAPTESQKNQLEDANTKIFTGITLSGEEKSRNIAVVQQEDGKYTYFDANTYERLDTNDRTGKSISEDIANQNPLNREGKYYNSGGKYEGRTSKEGLPGFIQSIYDPSVGKVVYISKSSSKDNYYEGYTLEYDKYAFYSKYKVDKGIYVKVLAAGGSVKPNEDFLFNEPWISNKNEPVIINGQLYSSKRSGKGATYAYNDLGKSADIVSVKDASKLGLYDYPYKLSSLLTPYVPRKFADGTVSTISQKSSSQSELTLSKTSVSEFEDELLKNLNNTEFVSKIAIVATDLLKESVKIMDFDKINFDDLGDKLKERLESIGVGADIWSEWINNENNQLTAFVLQNEDWNKFIENTSSKVLSAATSGKQNWTSFVAQNPLEAYNLLVSAWETMEQTIGDYMKRAKQIIDDYNTLISNTKISAPKIDSGAWDTLKNNIITKVQNVFNNIEEEFSKTPLNLNLSLNLGIEDFGKLDGKPEGDSFYNPSNAAKILLASKKYNGVPYVWGGTTRSGMDCSGFVLTVLKDVGILPSGARPTAQTLFSEKYGRQIDPEKAQPGDVVFFGKDTSNITHVGIKGLNGNSWESHGGRSNTASNPGPGVSYAPMNRKPIAAKRFYANGTFYGNLLSNTLGIAGENYKPEILIDKKTQQKKLISEPTIIDITSTDVVGEKGTQYILSSKHFAEGKPTTNVEWLKEIRNAATAFDIPPWILLALIDKESANGTARDTWQYNSHGAYGLTQVTKSALDDILENNKYSNEVRQILLDNGIDLNHIRQGGEGYARDNIWGGAASLRLNQIRYSNPKGGTSDVNLDYQNALSMYNVGLKNYTGSTGQAYATDIIDKAYSSTFLQGFNLLDNLQPGMAFVGEGIGDIVQEDPIKKLIEEIQANNQNKYKATNDLLIEAGANSDARRKEYEELYSRYLAGDSDITSDVIFKESIQMLADNAKLLTDINQQTINEMIPQYADSIEQLRNYYIENRETLTADQANEIIKAINEIEKSEEDLVKNAETNLVNLATLANYGGQLKIGEIKSVLKNIDESLNDQTVLLGHSTNALEILSSNSKSIQSVVDSRNMYREIYIAAQEAISSYGESEQFKLLFENPSFKKYNDQLFVAGEINQGIYDKLSYEFSTLSGENAQLQVALKAYVDTISTFKKDEYEASNKLIGFMDDLEKTIEDASSKLITAYEKSIDSNNKRLEDLTYQLEIVGDITKQSTLFEKARLTSENADSARESYYAANQRVQPMIEDWEKRYGFAVAKMFDDYGNLTRSGNKYFTDLFMGKQGLLKLSDEQYANFNWSPLLGSNRSETLSLLDQYAKASREEKAGIGQQLISKFGITGKNLNYDEFYEFIKKLDANVLNDILTDASKVQEILVTNATLRTNSLKADAERAKSIQELIEATEAHYDNIYNIQIKELNKRSEEIGADADKWNTKYNLLEKYFEVLRSIRSEQRELEKQLSTSKALQGYLDRDAYLKMFNQEDYNSSMRALNNYKRVTEEALDTYTKKINSLNEDTIYKAEYYETIYNNILEAEQEKVELVKLEYEYSKARLELENTYANRDTRMELAGGWRYVADPDKVKSAIESMSDAKAAYDEQKLQMEENDRLRQANETIADLNKEQGKISSNVNKITKILEEIKTDIIPRDNEYGYFAKGAGSAYYSTIGDANKTPEQLSREGYKQYGEEGLWLQDLSKIKDSNFMNAFLNSAYIIATNALGSKEELSNMKNYFTDEQLTDLFYNPILLDMLIQKLPEVNDRSTLRNILLNKSLLSSKGLTSSYIEQQFRKNSGTVSYINTHIPDAITATSSDDIKNLDLSYLTGPLHMLDENGKYKLFTPGSLQAKYMTSIDKIKYTNPNLVNTNEIDGSPYVEAINIQVNALDTVSIAGESLIITDDTIRALTDAAIQSK